MGFQYINNVTRITLRLLLPRPLRQNLPIRLHENDSTVPVSSDVALAGYPNKNSNKEFFIADWPSVNTYPLKR